MNVTFLGLDGEMSGTDPRRHALIQIGLALSEDDIFESNIGWAEFEYEEDALRAIDVVPAQIRQGPGAQEVDARLVEWLDARGIGKGTIVPVGWGVSDFDRPFVLKTLPRFNAYLHHHSIELNAVVYTLAGTRRYLGADVDFAVWKKMAKKVAEFAVLNRRGTPPKPHDAADDALLAILSWKWLREVIAVPSDDVALFESGRIDTDDVDAA